MTVTTPCPHVSTPQTHPPQTSDIHMQWCAHPRLIPHDNDDGFVNSEHHHHHLIPTSPSPSESPSVLGNGTMCCHCSSQPHPHLTPTLTSLPPSPTLLSNSITHCHCCLSLTSMSRPCLHPHPHPPHPHPCQVGMVEQQYNTCNCACHTVAPLALTTLDRQHCRHHIFADDDNDNSPRPCLESPHTPTKPMRNDAAHAISSLILSSPTPQQCNSANAATFSSPHPQ